MKIKSLFSGVRSGARDGVVEVVDDMTKPEYGVLSCGVGMGVGGAVVVSGIATAKAVLAVGVCVATVGIGKAFMRGFIGGMKHEFRKIELSNQE